MYKLFVFMIHQLINKQLEDAINHMVECFFFAPKSFYLIYKFHCMMYIWNQQHFSCSEFEKNIPMMIEEALSVIVDLIPSTPYWTEINKHTLHIFLSYNYQSKQAISFKLTV